MKYYHDIMGKNVVLTKIEGIITLETVKHINACLAKDFLSGQKYITIGYMLKDAMITDRACIKEFLDFTKENEKSYQERIFVGFQGLHNVFLKSYIALAKPSVPVSVFVTPLELKSKRNISLETDFKLIEEF